MPPLGLLLGKVDFSRPWKAAGAATLDYGVSINNCIDFLLVAFAVFLLVKQVDRFMPKAQAPAPVEAKDCDYCKSSIPKAATCCPHCTSQLAAG